MRPRSGARLAGGLLVGLAVLVLVVGAVIGKGEPRPPAPSLEARVLGATVARAPSHGGKGPRRAARCFLIGYLRYSYGRPGPLPGASAALRAELRRSPPRIPAALGWRRPRIASLAVEHRDPSRGIVLAVIDDGVERYALPLELRRTRGWRVAAIGH